MTAVQRSECSVGSRPGPWTPEALADGARQPACRVHRLQGPTPPLRLVGDDTDDLLRRGPGAVGHGRRPRDDPWPCQDLADAADRLADRLEERWREARDAAARPRASRALAQRLGAGAHRRRPRQDTHDDRHRSPQHGPGARRPRAGHRSSRSSEARLAAERRGVPLLRELDRVLRRRSAPMPGGPSPRRPGSSSSSSATSSSTRARWPACPPTTPAGWVSCRSRWEDERLVVATSDPTNVIALDDLRVLTGAEIKLVYAVAARHRGQARQGRTAPRKSSATSPQDMAGSRAEDIDDLSSLGDSPDDAPIVRYVNLLITQAIRPRLRHPRRADRARPAGALPHRRRAARDHALAQDHPGRRDLAG